MFRNVAAIVLLIAACASASPAAAPPSESDDLRSCFAQLLALGGYGRRPDERAAFVVARGDGRFDCVLWPATNGFRSASWQGSRPKGTVAIAHTHPRTLPDPSLHDAEEARRLGLPIYVLTPQQVALVAAEGQTSVLASGEGWWQESTLVKANSRFAGR
ncbi:MAG: Prokaryotic s of the domain [Acidobacteria bacterium]|nr:Prokaryotic s of the domain [Acidobacteriota bacterium]